MRAWVAERPLIRGGLLVGGAVVALYGLVMLVLLHQAGGRAVQPNASAPTASWAAASTPAPAATPAMTPVPVPFVTPDIPEGEAQAEATAGAFLVAYGSLPSPAGPGQLRASLRPWDTDRLDAELGQGGGGNGPATTSTLTVTSLSSLGLAPDGRLVLLAVVHTTSRGAAGPVTTSDRPAEVYLALTEQGWRVDEVAL